MKFKELFTGKEPKDVGKARRNLKKYGSVESLSDRKRKRLNAAKICIENYRGEVHRRVAGRVALVAFVAAGAAAAVGGTVVALSSEDGASEKIESPTSGRKKARKPGLVPRKADESGEWTHKEIEALGSYADTLPDGLVPDYEREEFDPANIDSIIADGMSPLDKALEDAIAATGFGAEFDALILERFGKARAPVPVEKLFSEVKDATVMWLFHKTDSKFDIGVEMDKTLESSDTAGAFPATMLRIINRRILKRNLVICADIYRINMYIAEVEPLEVASFVGQGNLEKEERRFLVLNVKDSHAAEELNGDAYGRHQPEIGAILINSMLGQGDLATSYNYLSSKHDIPWMAQDAKLDEVGPSGTAYRGDVVIPHEAMHAWMFIKYGYGLGGSRDIYSAGDIIEAHELELLGIDSRAEITPEIIDELAGHAFGILEGAEESELLGRYGFNLCTRNPLASPSSYKLETNVCTRLALSDGDFEWESMMNGRPFGSVEGLSRSTAEPINATLVSAMRNIGPLELSRDDYKIIGRAYTGMAINASVRAYERVRSGRH